MALIFLGLFLLEKYSAAFFVLFLLPIVHFPHALWCFFIVFLLSFFNGNFKKIILKNYKSILLGLGFTVSYFLYFKYSLNLDNQFSEFEVFDKSKWSQQIEGYYKYWDFHRQNILLFKSKETITLSFILVFAHLLILFKNTNLTIKNIFSHKVSNQNMTIFLLLGGSLIAIIASLVPEFLPRAFFRGMPGRFANYGLLISSLYFVVITLKSLSFSRLLTFAYITILCYNQALSTVENHRPLLTYQVILSLIIIYLLSLIIEKLNNRYPEYLNKLSQLDNILKLNSVGIMLFSLLFFLNCYNFKLKEMKSSAFIRDINKHNDFFDAISKQSKGMLLLSTKIPFYIQKPTKRPVVFVASSFDFIPYKENLVPITEKILNEIYGLSLAKDPSLSENGTGGIPYNKVHHELWEKRTHEEWSQLSSKYQFCEVITPKDWDLNLKLIAKNNHFKAFQLDNCSFQF